MKNLIKLQLLAVGASCMALAGTASAQIASTTYNGDTFYLFAGNNSWATDENLANAFGGYLAILPDAATVNAVYNGLIGNGFFQTSGGQAGEAYIGGLPADGSDSTGNQSNWSWVTSVPAGLYGGNPVPSVVPWSAFDAGNWDPNEPNGDSKGLAINRIGTSQFNDEGTATGGYIVEVSTPDGATTVGLLGGALLGLQALRRKLNW